VNGLVLAVRYLTIVPLPTRLDGDVPALGRAAVWFPVVGLALGAVLVGIDVVMCWLFPTLLSAVLTVTAWKLLTGGLHLDGMADCLDGLLGRDAEQRLAIMRDSRIGAFGAAGLVLLLMIDIVALSELPELVTALAALGAARMLGRFLSGRLGGITGDVLGAAVETAELALLLMLVAWIHTRR
jgi:adenosylcobinamide-GDP ribazoletransferase